MPDLQQPAQPDDEVSMRIDAPPERVYAIVTDVANMGRLSPECTGGSWLGGATGPAVGARFKGKNRRGVARWSTTNEVTVAEAGKAFGFKTLQSGYRWDYRLEPDGGGTIITESRAPFAERPLVAKIVATIFTKLLLGGEDGHTDELRAGMRQTLERVKAIAESA